MTISENENEEEAKNRRNMVIGEMLRQSKKPVKIGQSMKANCGNEEKQWRKLALWRKAS